VTSFSNSTFQVKSSKAYNLFLQWRSKEVRAGQVRARAPGRRPFGSVSAHFCSNL